MPICVKREKKVPKNIFPCDSREDTAPSSWTITTLVTVVQWRHYVWVGVCVGVTCIVDLHFENHNDISEANGAISQIQHCIKQYHTMHHFATKTCTHVHIAVAEWCIVGYGAGVLWDFLIRLISKQQISFRINEGQNGFPNDDGCTRDRHLQNITARISAQGFEISPDDDQTSFYTNRYPNRFLATTVPHK